MAFLCIDQALVFPSPDVVYDQFHYELILRQQTFRMKWIGRQYREDILLWARNIPVYYPGKSKASSSYMTYGPVSRGKSKMPPTRKMLCATKLDLIHQPPSTSDFSKPTVQCHSAFAVPFGSRFNARDIKEFAGGAHVQFTLHACVQTLIGVGIHPSIQYLPMTCFCTQKSCR